MSVWIVEAREAIERGVNTFHSIRPCPKCKTRARYTIKREGGGSMCKMCAANSALESRRRVARKKAKAMEAVQVYTPPHLLGLTRKEHSEFVKFKVQNPEVFAV